jgi:hypothetical protein
VILGLLAPIQFPLDRHQRLVDDRKRSQIGGMLLCRSKYTADLILESIKVMSTQ